MNDHSMVLEDDSFGSFLEKQGNVSKDLLRIIQREMQKQGISLEKALLSLYIFNEKQLAELFSQFSKLPFMDLFEIKDFSLEVEQYFPKELLSTLLWLPFKKEKRTLHISISTPINTLGMAHIQNQFSHFKCIFYISLPSQMRVFFQKHKKDNKEIAETLSEILIRLDESSPKSSSLSSTDLIPKVLDKCLLEAVLQDASDIHLEPELKFIRLRLRVDGHLRPYTCFHRDFWDNLCVHLKVCAYMNIAETRAPQSGRFSRRIQGKNVDFRVSSHPTKHGESIVIRILDRKNIRLSLEEIGFSPPIVSKLKKATKDTQGLFIVSGPTGSGKTTTLYSILNGLNTKNRNIMTLEQPIEYEIPSVRQTEIKEKSSFTFAEGIRSILRQDPDILFVGEVRDTETAQMALRASMTGHQVYTTLHTSQALGSIQRLIDLGIPSSVLAGNLKGLLSQRLVRKLCLHCRQPREMTFQEMTSFKSTPERSLYKPVGCSHCCQTGYKGRFPLVEFISCTDSFNQLILQKEALPVLEKEARKNGYIPLIEQGINCALTGLTSFEEIYSIMPFQREIA